MLPTQEILDDLKDQIAKRFTRSSWGDLEEFVNKSEWVGVGPFSVHPSNFRVIEAVPTDGKEFFVENLSGIVLVEMNDHPLGNDMEVMATNNLESVYKVTQDHVTLNIYRKIKAECPAYFVTIHSAEGMTLYSA